MRRFLTVVLAGLLALAGGVVVSGQAFGAVVNCTGDLTGTVNADVIVPSNSTCNIQGATVNGNVSVQAGGRIIINGGSTINGNVWAPSLGTDTQTFSEGRTFSAIICNSKITGTVTLDKAPSEVTVGGTSRALGKGCGGNSIGGNVTLANNTGPVSLSENGGPCQNVPGGTCGIGGNANVNSNTGPVSVFDNNITGNLSCALNGTITAAGNTVGGTKNGQCASGGNGP